MYQLKISQWFGRLGNNLQQLSNAIYIAEKTRSTLSFPRHKMITSSYFDFSGGRSCKHQILSDFWNDKLENFAVTIEEIEEKRSGILKNNILPLLPYKRKKLDFDMVIHFRGGDIFRKNPHHNMVQAPYSYFRRVLEIQGVKRVLLVCEDNKNPIVPKLQNSGSGIDFIYHSGTIEEDINLILNAKALALPGNTSFSRILAQTSLNLEKVYLPIPGNDPRLLKFDIEAVYVSVDDYINLGQWKFDSIQKKMLVEHPLSKTRLYAQ